MSTKLASNRSNTTINNSNHHDKIFGAIIEHFSESWNVLDFLSLSSNLAGHATRFAGQQSWSTTLFAIALPLAYLNTLYFMQGFKAVGQLIRMILGIISGIRAFMLILVVCMVGFSMSFYILYQAGPGSFTVAGGSGEGEGDVQDYPFGMETVPMSLFTGYLLLLGNFDAEEFSASANYGLTLTLFIVFMFFINIVMLNLLIAIMGDIFERIQEVSIGWHQSRETASSLQRSSSHLRIPSHFLERNGRVYVRPRQDYSRGRVPAAGQDRQEVVVVALP